MCVRSDDVGIGYPYHHVSQTILVTHVEDSTFRDMLHKTGPTGALVIYIVYLKIDRYNNQNDKIFSFYI